MIALLLSTVLGPMGFRPWGNDALEEARRGSRPLMLLVSDAGCEALGDTSFLSVASERFVPVELDTLEHPEIADLYKTAAALLPEAPQEPSGRLLYLLTPELRPFAAVPCEARAIAAVLEGLAAEFRERRAEVEARAGAVVALLREAQSGESARGTLGEDVPARALAGLVDAMDPVRGGYRTTPKTLPHGALVFLLEEQRRRGGTEGLRLLRATLDGMGHGGIRDPGAGFFVGAATEDWGQPRLRKRLADNALLLRAFAQAPAVTGDQAYRVIADEIASFLVREAGKGDGALGAELPLAVGPSTETDRELDSRVIAGWNGLMISGLAASGRTEDLEAATRAATVVLQRLGPAALLRRWARGGELGGSALFEDYAYLIDGLLDLAEATGERRWIDEASSLTSVAVSRFLDADRGGFFETDERHGMLPVRIRNGYDGALPSANGVMASALLKLSRATGEARHSAMARRTVEAFLGDLQKAPRGLETLAAAAGEMLGRGAPPASSDPALPSRVVKGPVTVEAALSAPRVKPGGALDARVVLTIAAGHRVNARTAGKDLFGLSVSVPGEDFVASAPRYPEGLSPYMGTVTVTVPLRVRRGRPPGEGHVRVRVLFQACDAIECLAPDSALLEVPVTILAPGR